MADSDNWQDEVDLLVVGSGAGGLGAAVVGAQEGLSVVVLEKTEWLGGTTAYSARTCWMPGHRRQPNPAADAAAAQRYLDELVGDRAPRTLRTAYLDQGPAMLDYMERVGVRFWHSPTAVDYHPEIEGAGTGRALEPHTFDGRELGSARFGRVRWPVPEFALFKGTLMVRRSEVNELLGIFHGSLPGMSTAARLGLRWAVDRLRYSRGTRLAMGNALVANLYHKLVQRSGDVWFGARATGLVTDDAGRVVGAVVIREGRTVRAIRLWDSPPPPPVGAEGSVPVTIESETAILVVNQIEYGPAGEMSLPRSGVYTGHAWWENRQATGDYYQTTLDRPTDDTFEDDLTEAWNNPPVTERYVLDLAYSRASEPGDDEEL